MVLGISYCRCNLSKFPNIYCPLELWGQNLCLLNKNFLKNYGCNYTHCTHANATPESDTFLAVGHICNVFDIVLYWSRARICAVNFSTGILAEVALLSKGTYKNHVDKRG